MRKSVFVVLISVFIFSCEDDTLPEPEISLAKKWDVHTLKEYNIDINSGDTLYYNFQDISGAVQMEFTRNNVVHHYQWYNSTPHASLYYFFSEDNDILYLETGAGDTTIWRVTRLDLDRFHMERNGFYQNQMWYQEYTYNALD